MVKIKKKFFWKIKNFSEQTTMNSLTIIGFTNVHVLEKYKFWKIDYGH